MTLNEFKNKYLGKTVGYPTNNDYLGQCLSLVKWYIKECFGFDPPPSGSGSAYGYWSNFPSPLGSYFNKVENTPDGVPLAGDIIIWQPTTSNPYGHIAIFLEGNANSFRSLDQNYGGKECHIQGHYYTNVKGWLTPKLNMQEKVYTQAEWQLERDERNKNWDLYQAEKADHEATKAKLDEVKKDLRQFVETLAGKLTTIADQSEIIGAVERLLTVEDQNSQLSKENTKLKQDKLDMEADKNREISKLRAEVEEVIKQKEEMKLQIANQEADIKRLSDRLDELLELPQTEKPETGVLMGLFNVIFSFIKGIWQKK